MKQVLLITILLITIILGCNNPNETGMKNREKEKSTTGYASLGDLKMYYEIHGTGKVPLVLLHGGGSTIETSFANILPLLAKHRHVIAVELQAHGRTSDREGPVTFEQDADDVAALLKYLQIDSADVLGFSNGGSTAMQMGIRHPGIVHKLVIISSFYKREGMIPGFFEMMEKVTLADMPAPLKVAYEKVAADKNHLQVMHDKDKERMVQFKDWPEDHLRSIKSPALLMVADHDVVTVEHTVAMSHVIPDANLMVLPGSHGSFIGEVCTVEKGSRLPELTVVAIEEFLDK